MAKRVGTAAARRQRLRGLLVLSVVLAATALLAGCGGSAKSSGSGSGASGSATGSAGGGTRTVSADTYVKSVCQGMSSFINSAKSLDTLGKSTSTKSLKAGLVKVTSNLESAMSNVQSAVAGTVPDVKGGAAFAQHLQTSLAKVGSSSKQWVSEAKALPTANATAFGTATEKLAKQMSTGAKPLNSTGLEGSAALKKVAESDPTCKSVEAAGA